MKRKQALRIIEKSIQPTLRQLAFMASLYEQGLVRDSETKRAYQKRKKILEALDFLKNEPVQEKLF